MFIYIFIYIDTHKYTPDFKGVIIGQKKNILSKKNLHAPCNCRDKISPWQHKNFVCSVKFQPQI